MNRSQLRLAIAAAALALVAFVPKSARAANVPFASHSFAYPAGTIAPNRVSQAALDQAVKVKLQDRNKKSPGQVKIQVGAKNGTWPVTNGSVPIRATLSIGDGALGLCTDTDFKASECAFNGSGNKLQCKR